MVYIAAEGQEGIRLRIEAWKRSFGNSADIPFFLIPANLNLRGTHSDLHRVAAVLENTAKEWGEIALIVVDTLAATFGDGDENGGDMAAYVADLAKLCAPYKCARLIVHHQPLNEAKRPRGHGSLLAAADTAVLVATEGNTPVRRISVTKQKDMDAEKEMFFELRSLEISLDEDGEPITSCVVAPADESDHSPNQKLRLTGANKIAFDHLRKMLADAGYDPPPNIPEATLNRKRVKKVAEFSSWRSATVSALIRPDIRPDSAQKAFNRARDKLNGAGIVGIYENWVWLL